MSTVKKNFFYSTILTISGYLFPLITYPYVTRVLGVDKIGVCNFVDSIIQYGILFSMMGIGTLAIREIAQSKNNQRELSQTFSSLLTLNFFTAIIATVAILFLTFYVPKFHDYQKLLLIGSSKILFSALLVEWLYKGLEEFKYITIRSLLIKVLYVVAIFVFVKNEDDYIIYFFINVVMVVINAIINTVYSRNYLYFTVSRISFKPYLKPFVILGLYTILTSMYTSFNITYLGLVTDTTEVGYYSTAVKLYTLVLSVFTAFTGVMMPRQSTLLGERKVNEFLRLTNKSIDLLLACIIPLVVYVLCYADNIVLLIAGKGYEGAILPLRIIVPLLLVIGYEQVVVIQMLMPLKKDKAILINSIVGASVGIILNIILVPQLKSVGSAIVWIMSEFAVMISAQLFIKKYILFNFPWKKIIHRLLVSIPILLLCYCIRILNFNYVYTLLIGLVIVTCYYSTIELFVYKNEYIQLLLSKIQDLRK